MIKYQHNEFQSDIFLLLETFKAAIEIGENLRHFFLVLLFFCSSVDLNGSRFSVSVRDFLKVDMKRKVMRNIILESIDDSYKYYTYKVYIYIYISLVITNIYQGQTLIYKVANLCCLTLYSFSKRVEQNFSITDIIKTSIILMDLSI